MKPSAHRFTYFKCGGRLLRVSAAASEDAVYLQYEGDEGLVLPSTDWTFFQALQHLEWLGEGADDVPPAFSNRWEIDGTRWDQRARPS